MGHESDIAQGMLAPFGPRPRQAFEAHSDVRALGKGEVGGSNPSVGTTPSAALDASRPQGET